MPKALDLCGVKNNRLTGVMFLYRKHKKRYWLFHCSCGNFYVTHTNAFKSGHVKSCGCYMKDLNASYVGENNPNWNPNRTHEQRVKERKTVEDANWRKEVFERDEYVCQKCGQKGGELNAHHKDGWSRFPKRRLDPDNGVTLCKTCHTYLHHLYGRFTEEKDYEEFVK